jgi:small-conductance mechanosensitive channel
VNADLPIASFLSRFVKITIFILAASMALELLGIGKDTVIVAFAIVFGGIVLALAIAFGLGAQDVAKEYLEKKLKERDEKRDRIEHI